MRPAKTTTTRSRSDMPFGPDTKIGDASVAGMPQSGGELEECFRRTNYMVPEVKAWAIEHSFGIWKAMYAWHFEQQDGQK